MYIKETTTHGWIIYESGHDVRNPLKAVTFAFDTENIVLCDGKQLTQSELYEAIKNDDLELKRNRLESIVWAWQCYDEYNGFFMTNNFYYWLRYCCLCGYKFGWCYNAKFDFSQIDYKILCEHKKNWKQHEKNAKTRGQAWTYSSLHNDMGARYNYKLWIPYINKYRHKRVHAIDLRDFMNLYPSGLANVLKSLNVVDNDGVPVRKLEMEYQAVDFNNLTEDEINYCCNDVKGLYFAVKIYNKSIEEQSAGESHIFGEDTNIMTAGGYAKRELLRSLYPDLKPKKRIKEYQKQHPLTVEQDEYLRKNHLYRGGICYVNEHFKGILTYAWLEGCKMNRYDVNSEYPYAMSIMQDLVGEAKTIKYNEWLKMVDNGQSDQYECVLILTAVHGVVKRGYCGLWYNPFRRDFVDIIEEDDTHLMFEREFIELSNWYDLEYTCEDVIIVKRGERVYAPFVHENYELKAQAKREGNSALSSVVKLKLNSSYGKLAERIERITGDFEENTETGCVHFVRKGCEIEEKSAMSVLVGALVTSIARCYIMSKIREICGENMQQTFVYIDTDSIHCFADYSGADAYTLGGLKLEAQCEAVKYLAPKTYADIEHIDLDNDEINVNDAELHTKGINIKAVRGAIGDKISIKEFDKKFDYGQQFIVLMAMNVRGGKVLVPVTKYLARPELAPNQVINSGYDGNFISEI